MIYLCIHGFMIVQSYTCRIMTMINDSCQHRCGIYKQAFDIFFSKWKLRSLWQERTSLVTSVKRLIALCRSVPIKWLGYWKDDHLYRLGAALVGHGLVSELSFHATLNGSMEERRTLETRSRHAHASKKNLSTAMLYGTNESNVTKLTCRITKRSRSFVRSTDWPE